MSLKENLVSKNDRLIIGSLIGVFTYLFYFYELPYIFILIILLFSLFELIKCEIFKNLSLIIPLLYSPLLLSVFFIESSIYSLFIFILFILINITFKNYIKEIFLFNFFLFFYFIFLIIHNSTINIFHIIFIAFFNDTAAFIFGKMIKGPLIIPSVSPNKTWSGTSISFFLSTLILFLLNFDILISMILSISIFFGDIFFSYIKRFLNIKDFSRLLGSHGGVLDRLDSMFFVSIIFQIFLVYLI